MNNLTQQILQGITQKYKLDHLASFFLLRHQRKSKQFLGDDSTWAWAELPSACSELQYFCPWLGEEDRWGAVRQTSRRNDRKLTAHMLRQYAALLAALSFVCSLCSIMLFSWNYHIVSPTNEGYVGMWPHSSPFQPIANHQLAPSATT